MRDDKNIQHMFAQFGGLVSKMWIMQELGTRSSHSFSRIQFYSLLFYIINSFRESFSFSLPLFLSLSLTSSLNPYLEIQSLILAETTIFGVVLNPLQKSRHSRVDSGKVFPRTSVAPGYDTNKHQPFFRIIALHAQRSAGVTLARVPFSFSRVSGAQHVSRYHFARVIGLGHALFVGDDWHLDFLQDARRFAVFFQGAPARSDRLSAHKLLLQFCKREIGREGWESKVGGAPIRTWLDKRYSLESNCVSAAALKRITISRCM